MKRLNAFTLTAILVAGTALAHSGVKNPAVKARMDAMMAIGKETKTLGEMAKGAMPFDLKAAQTAAAAIADHAASTPGLFEANETDPKSEAKASIWVNFDDFTAKATELEVVAKDLSSSITSSDDLGSAMMALGATCKSCHAAYREKTQP